MRIYAAFPSVNMAFPSYKKRLKKEMDHWGEDRMAVPVTWFDLPTIQKYINKWVTGRPDLDWLDYIMARHAAGGSLRGLVVGCGHGDLERHLLDRKLFDSLVAFDVSPKAIETARAAAAEAGYADRVEYLQLDANFMDRQKWSGEFDVVFGPMAIHHFIHLERSLTSIRKALKKRGLFLVNEYTGPSQFQWTVQQVSIANEVLSALPDRYLRNIRKPEMKKTHVIRPPVAEMDEDGFEAVRSADIIPAMKKEFEILEVRPYGGTILHLVFEAIAANFDDENDLHDTALISFCCLLERQLLENGVIPHDHAVIAARRNR